MLLLNFNVSFVRYIDEGYVVASSKKFYKYPLPFVYEGSNFENLKLALICVLRHVLLFATGLNIVFNFLLPIHKIYDSRDIMSFSYNFQQFTSRLCWLNMKYTNESLTFLPENICMYIEITDVAAIFTFFTLVLNQNEFSTKLISWYGIYFVQMSKKTVFWHDMGTNKDILIDVL